MKKIIIKFLLLIVILGWTSQSFNTIADLITFLNTLPPEQAAGAQVSASGGWPPLVLVYHDACGDGTP